jgi:hypothetical protein
MTPYRLFEYMLAAGAGLFVVGTALIVVILLLALALGWARRPSPGP